MPVSFIATPNLEASEWPLDSDRVPKGAYNVITGASANLRVKPPINTVDQTSVTEEELQTIVPAHNGFMQAALTAYGSHLNLCIR